MKSCIPYLELGSLHNFSCVSKEIRYQLSATYSCEFLLFLLLPLFVLVVLLLPLLLLVFLQLAVLVVLVVGIYKYAEAGKQTSILFGISYGDKELKMSLALKPLT